MSRWRNGDVQIDLPAVFVPAISKVFKDAGKTLEAEDMLGSVKKYNSTSVNIELDGWGADFTKEVLSALLHHEITPPKSIVSLIKGYGRVISNPHGAKVRSLKLLPRLIIEYLSTDAIDGWLYRRTVDDVHVAYVVKDVYYHEPNRRDERSYVIMHLSCNRARGNYQDELEGGVDTTSVTFDRDDIEGRTVDQVLLAAHYLKETEELKAEYEQQLKLYQDYQPQKSKQFLCSNRASNVSGSWWSADDGYRLPHPTKMVNDEDLLERTSTMFCGNDFWEEYEVGEMFRSIPLHPYLLMYDLTKYTLCWVHVSNMKPYVYDPSLRDKLVLPQKHRDLIDVLTADMDVFMEDIIGGKSGGTAILCHGAPGLGKTLTAEVYSEIVERPLYRVPAGQLGTTLGDVEKNLMEILQRAERWGAVMLLDEADVYIRRRGEDLNHNAVVAAFLRTLEYFNGLLFLTTNRANDVDDAIASRMVAMFKYEIPDEEQAKQLWTILSNQFELIIPEKRIDRLVAEFKGISGRDIKQLLKLTAKYCKRKNVKLDVEAFRICAMFRGLN